MDSTAELWHQHNRRAGHECVWRDGVDITDTVHPDDWPADYRHDFYTRGWRPWTPAGVEPLWWVVVVPEDREPRPPDHSRPHYNFGARANRSARR